MKTRRIYVGVLENVEAWESHNPGFTSIGFSDTLRMRKYRDLETVSLYARRWCGEWVGYGKPELICSLFKM